MRGKGPKSPFVILTLVLFGRKKNSQEEAPVRPLESFPIPDTLRKTVTDYDVSKARNHLRIASLERDIIGSALTTIYEAEAKGQLNESERNQLVQRYKVDLKRVDGEIDTYKKVVDLHELESAKEDLLKSFNEKLMEIDARINRIKPALGELPAMEEKMPQQNVTQVKTENSATEQSQPPSKEKTAKERPKNKAEERLDAIREEVLKAMERLEQIETEG